jgi:hypothetical protein
MLTKEEKDGIKKIKTKLLYNERIEIVEKQAFTHNTSIVPLTFYITNQRVIIKKSFSIIASFSLIEYVGIVSIDLKKGILNSSIIINTRKDRFSLNAINKNKAKVMFERIDFHLRRYKHPDINGNFKPQLNRKSFPESTQEAVLIRQRHRCNNCNCLLKLCEFDHISRNPSNNSPENCQALCPNCHAYKTKMEVKIK